MKVQIPLGINIDIKNFLRQHGYSFQINYQTNRSSFARRLTSDSYPRFHIYLEKDASGRSYICLHLDQKKSSHEGSNAHGADYEGDIVQRECNHLKRQLYAAVSALPVPQVSKQKSTLWEWLKNL